MASKEHQAFVEVTFNRNLYSSQNAIAAERINFQVFIRKCKRDLHTELSKSQFLICVVVDGKNKSNLLMKLLQLKLQTLDLQTLGDYLRPAMSMSCRIRIMMRCWPALKVSG